MLVGHTLDEGDQEFQARGQRAVVLAQALDHPGVLLRDDLEGARHEQQRDDGKNNDNFHGMAPVV
jgi:hypothetical protein